MSSVSGASSLSGQAQQNPYGDPMRNLDVNQFLRMMIAELQNQDPLNPMDNAQIVEQIGQIREITANERLTETLESVFLSQNLSTAGKMIGDWVVSLGDDGFVQAAGRVDHVSITEGVPRLHTGDTGIYISVLEDIRTAVPGGRSLSLENISFIQSEEQGLALAEALLLEGREVRIGEAGSLLAKTGRIEGISIGNGSPKFRVGGVNYDREDFEVIEPTY